jgi:hypothetical protein
MGAARANYYRVAEAAFLVWRQGMGNSEQNWRGLVALAAPISVYRLAMISDH